MDKLQEKDSQARIVLELQNVSCHQTAAEAVKLRGVSLQMRQGDLILIRLERRQNPRGFASLIQGLSSPASGNVRFEQSAWDNIAWEQQFRMRSRIGRVFDGRAWINNLNVTENVMLRPRHHAIGESKLDQQIQDWTHRLQIPTLTRQRPAFVEATVLQQYQWLRAFLGNPSLVILERPMKTLDGEKLTPLYESVNEIRKQSAAVIWFAGSDEEILLDWPGTVTRFQSSDGKLIPIHQVQSSVKTKNDKGGSTR
jgi:phospholipid/cholesterol/gamma-HCH transport system ATP-binding protein